MWVIQNKFTKYFEGLSNQDSDLVYRVFFAPKEKVSFYKCVVYSPKMKEVSEDTRKRSVKIAKKRLFESLSTINRVLISLGKEPPFPEILGRKWEDEIDYDKCVQIYEDLMSEPDPKAVTG